MGLKEKYIKPPEHTRGLLYSPQAIDRGHITLILIVFLDDYLYIFTICAGIRVEKKNNKEASVSTWDTSTPQVLGKYDMQAKVKKG